MQNEVLSPWSPYIFANPTLTSTENVWRHGIYTFKKHLFISALPKLNTFIDLFIIIFRVELCLFDNIWKIKYLGQHCWVLVHWEHGEILATIVRGLFNTSQHKVNPFSKDSLFDGQIVLTSLSHWASWPPSPGHTQRTVLPKGWSSVSLWLSSIYSAYQDKPTPKRYNNSLLPYLLLAVSIPGHQRAGAGTMCCTDVEGSGPAQLWTEMHWQGS